MLPLGDLPIHYAAQCGHLSVIKYMLERGIGKSVTRYDGLNVLHLASLSGNLACVQHLVEEICLNVKARVCGQGKYTNRPEVS